MSLKKIICAAIASITLCTFSMTMETYTEIKSLKEIKTAGLPKGTLILSDMDETLAIDIGHAESEDVKKMVPKGKTWIPIEKDCGETFMNMRKDIGGREDSTLLVITKRQKYNKKKSNGWDKAHQHLAQINVPLSSKRYKHLNGVTLNNNPDSTFFDGVIYTAGDKGTHLDAFLTLAKIKPKYIVAIDDKPGNLKSIEDYCKSKGIPVKCYKMIAVVNHK